MTRVATTKHTETYRWSAAVDAKTVGAHALRGPTLPAGSVVTDALLLVDTPPTGGTATDTLSLGVETATDVLNAAARNATPWSTQGAKRCTQTATSSPSKLSVDRQPTLTINGTELTAGAIRVVLTVLEVV